MKTGNLKIALKDKKVQMCTENKEELLYNKNFAVLVKNSVN